MNGSPSDMLRANLSALARTEPELARRIEQAPAAEVAWIDTPQGLLSGSVLHEGRRLALASRYDPGAEAAKLLAAVDSQKHAAVIVLGVALGYHIQRLAQQFLDGSNIVIVHEPDLPLLRAVLERMDHTSWLGRPDVVLVDDTVDRGSMLGRIERCGGIMTQGTVLIAHPACRLMHGEAHNRFGSMMTDLLAYFRTNVATSLVNASRTVRNSAVNVGWYVAADTTDELANAAVGYPAVCVGAGPSLARNVHLLQDPEIRSRVIVISAQTTLKPLLQRGIRPDFVTALDYHEISRRFYEGLPSLGDDPPVTLVVEPKANPAIIDSFPGPVRVTHSALLQRLLGDHARPIQSIPSGATVAHLSFYLAQHLGCDPIILIGQDLGFSDGLYYCPGTAIHEVWQPELNAFNTLEMMEWQRIVRHRGLLQRQQDIHDQPVFTDEQMLTYLKQFERDFARARQQVIDASEGGLPKQNTVRMTLAEALAKHATRPTPPLPRATTRLDTARLDQALSCVQHRLDETLDIRRLAQQTIPLLRDMLTCQRDYDKANRIHNEIEKQKRRVDQLQETFSLVNELNTIGSFRRARADRAIHHGHLDPYEVQKRQIERDIDNLDWLIQACDEAATIFRDALERVREQKRHAGAARASGAAVEPARTR